MYVRKLKNIIFAFVLIYVMKRFCLLCCLLVAVACSAEKNSVRKEMVRIDGVKCRLADRPLFRDPVYDGAADPVLCYIKGEKKWFMYYTNRRANVRGTNGVTWVHGTRIGIAESSDGGATWSYRDTCNINYRPDADYTHWAPEVLEYEGMYHMFLTYVPGIFSDWEHPRVIIHLTSANGIDWDYRSTLPLVTDKVIDACVCHMPDGTWRLWYNNERDGKSMYYAESPDLYNWTDKGKVNMQTRGEGPKVFRWKDRYWMVVDAWRGLSVYYSDDALNWTQQDEYLVEQPGTGVDDKVKGQHPDVQVVGDRAFLFYFTHPGPGEGERDTRRSTLHVTELKYVDGSLTCDRNEPVYINLGPFRK